MFRNSFPTQVNGIYIITTHDIVEGVRMKRKQDKSSIAVKLSIVNKIAIYPQQGVHIIYHDQMNIIDMSVAENKDNMEEHGERDQQYMEVIVPTIVTIRSAKKKTKLTRCILKVQRD